MELLASMESRGFTAWLSFDITVVVGHGVPSFRLGVGSMSLVVDKNLMEG